MPRMRASILGILLVIGLPAWSIDSDFCKTGLVSTPSNISAPRDVVIVGDSIEEMDKLPAASVDLVFADPPYNLQLKRRIQRPDESFVDAIDEKWDKFANFAEYDIFTKAWLNSARRVMKPNATIVVMGTYHNIFRVGAVLQDLGFWILNDIIWLKANPMPNFNGRRFTNAHETMIWATLGPQVKAYTFNHEILKAGNEDCQVRSDWYLPICNGRERLKDNSGRKAHPTQKPEALLSRVLLAVSNPGDLILDPFFGTGTTGAVAKSLRRSFIGIEKDPTYAALAVKRIEDIQPLKEEAVFIAPTRRAEPRVAFAELVETGLIVPGEKLVDIQRRHSVTVRADGTLSSGTKVGSIHKICALLRNLPGCNGWLYWYVERDGKLRSIDELRSHVRESWRIEKLPEK